jgi:predicted amidophosphoribosyltransferase
MDVTETRQCSACEATITLIALPYCWQCRAPLGLSGPDPTERKVKRTLRQAALWLIGIAVIATTIWWALQ